MSIHCGVTNRLPMLFNQEEMARINEFIKQNDALSVEEKMRKAGVKWWNRERGTVVSGANFHPVRRLLDQVDANQKEAR